MAHFRTHPAKRKPSCILHPPPPPLPPTWTPTAGPLTARLYFRQPPTETPEYYVVTALEIPHTTGTYQWRAAFPWKQYDCEIIAFINLADFRLHAAFILLHDYSQRAFTQYISAVLEPDIHFDTRGMDHVFTMVPSSSNLRLTT